MNLRILALTLVFLASPALAEIYRSIGPDGTVIFSDRKARGAEKVDLPPLPVYTPRAQAPPSPALAPGQSGLTSYKSLRMLKPANEETIHDNNGLVEVSLALDPALDRGQGHRIRVSLDDTEHTIETTSVRFSNIDRGTHVLRASVVDEKGKILITTKPVTIYLRRPSRLMPGRAGTGGQAGAAP